MQSRDASVSLLESLLASALFAMAQPRAAAEAAAPLFVLLRDCLRPRLGIGFAYLMNIDSAAQFIPSPSLLNTIRRRRLLLDIGD